MGEPVLRIDDRVGGGEHLSVLLIEDDAATADLYRTRLEIDGYTVSVADDGESGVWMALAMLPDLIYLDLALPNDVDGFQVLERLRANRRSANIPVVILTNFTEPALRYCGLQLGALEFLIKAETTPARLSRATRALVRRRPVPAGSQAWPRREGSSPRS